jgi:hypothetical protein
MYMTTPAAILASTTIPFDTVDYDPLGSLTTGVGAHYTCPVDGYYLVMTNVEQTTNAALYVEIQKNGVSQSQSTYYATFVSNTEVKATDVVKCVAGDTLSVMSGGNPFSYQANTWNCYVTFVFMRPA